MHGSVQHSATVLNKPNLVKQVCFPLSTMHYCPHHSIYWWGL